MLSGTSDQRLTITSGGTVDAPVIYSGGGTATVRGINVEASNVIVQGFISTHAAAIGAKLVGNNIVFQDNTTPSEANTASNEPSYLVSRPRINFLIKRSNRHVSEVASRRRAR